MPPLSGADATDRLRTDSGSITRILAYLREPEAPHIAPPARGPRWEEDFDTREGDVHPECTPTEYEFDQRVSW